MAEHRGLTGPLDEVSAWAFKYPSVQVRDEVTRRWFEDFVQPEKMEILEEVGSARSR